MQLEGVTAFAEQMAKQLTEDPNQQALIVEGMRATFLNRSKDQHPAGMNQLFDERSLPQRFFIEKTADSLKVWDFFILLNSASLCTEWLTDGRIRLPNFRRDADPIYLEASVVQKYVEYLTIACPNALPQSANAETLKPSLTNEKSTNV